MTLAVKISSLLVLALAGISAAGAQGNVVNEMGKPPGNFPIPSNAKLELSLKTNKKKYSDTDVIRINFTVKNKGKEEATLSFPDGQKYDFELRKGKDMKAEKVWQFSKGRMSIMVFTSAKIAPSKELVFKESYKAGETGGDGKELPKLTAGMYSLTGILRTAGRTPRPTKTITFQVK